MLSWNCQGLGTPQTVQALKAMVAFERPDLVFLMETKNADSVLKNLQRRFHFAHSFLRALAGLSGGLALFWNDLFALLFFLRVRIL